jgi:ketosteroid isomerase-like protein
MTLLQPFLTLYTDLSDYSAGQLATVYSDDVEFIDPVTTHHGLSAVEAYFEKLLFNCQSCMFEIQSAFIQGSTGHVSWIMRFQHRRLKSGQPIEVEGFSLLNFYNGKVIRQQDYYDMGAMIYEHMPMIGSIITALRRRLAA